MANRRLKSYKFDIGNSSKGALGMVIRVWAYTKREAVEKANRFLGDHEWIEVAGNSHKMGIEYCTVYFGPNLKVRHIAGGEEIEEVSPESAELIERSSSEYSQLIR